MLRRFEPLDGEHIIVEEPIHWKNYLLPAAVMSLSLTLFLIRVHFEDYSVTNAILGWQLVTGSWITLVTVFEELLLCAVMLSMFAKIVTISYTKYYLTNKRIISISGVFSINFQEMILSRCEMVFLHQNAYERIYNCGDILCVSAGASLFMDDVRDALRFKQTIMAVLGKRKEYE